LISNCLSCFQNPGRWTVPVMAVTQCLGYSLHQMGRRLESKGHWVPNVQVADFGARGLHPLGLDDDITDSVGKPLDPRRCGDRCVRNAHVRILARRHEGSRPSSDYALPYRQSKSYTIFRPPKAFFKAAMSVRCLI